MKIVGRISRIRARKKTDWSPAVWASVFLTMHGHTAQSSQFFQHRVRAGETLSDIIYERFGSPVYGNRGLLKYVLELNSSIKNPDHVLVGQAIKLPIDPDQFLKENNASVSKNASAQETSTPRATHANEVRGKMIVGPGAMRSPATIENPTCRVEREDTPDESYDLFSATPEFFFRRLDVIDKNTNAPAMFISGIDYGASADWRQGWTEDFSTAISLGVTKMEYKSAGSRTLEGASSTLSHFGLLGEWKPFSSVALGLSAGYQQRLFVRSGTSSKISFESSFVPEFGVLGSIEILRLSNRVIGIEGDARLIMPVTADGYYIDGGFGYRGGLFIAQKFGTFDLRVSLWRNYWTQNTTLVEQREEQVGVGVTFGFPFRSASSENCCK